MNVFKKLREERNLTQEDLAIEFGITRQAISAIERGENPRFDILKKFAAFYNVSCDTLLGVEFKRDSPNVTVIAERSQAPPQVSSGSIA